MPTMRKIVVAVAGSLLLAACRGEGERDAGMTPSAATVAEGQEPGGAAAGEFSAEEIAAMRAGVVSQFGEFRIPITTVGILLYEGFTTLDAMGPYQVFSELPGVQVMLIAAEKGIVRNMAGVGITATHALRDVERVDVLVVPGGFGGTYRAAHDTTITNWIKRVHPTTTYTTSVCTGAWILGGAGLLRGRDATTHWYGKDILEQEFGARYRAERWVQSDKIWTSAGVTAGMDLSLELVRQIAGEGFTRAAMLDLEYAPEPPLRGGTEATTPAETVEWLRAMYDRGIAATKAQMARDSVGR
jgi:putative intracellular protease/amidase